MKIEDKILFLTTRQSFTPAHVEKILQLTLTQPIIDWNKIYLAANQNGVVPLINKNFTCYPELAAKIPGKIRVEYQQHFQQVHLLKKMRENNLVNALDYLAAKGLKAILFKGIALDHLVYDQPWYTISSDIDLIINKKQGDFSKNEFNEIRHTFHHSGIEYDFYSHHDMDMNGMLAVNFDEVWDKAIPFKVQNKDALVLSTDDFLLSLCVNSCRKRFLRIKSLLDIAETIQRLPGLNWEQFAARCKSFDCANIAYTALQVTHRTIGCDIPENLEKLLGISRLRAANISTSINFLLQVWSFTFPASNFYIFNRLAELSLILPYASYKPRQLLYLAKHIYFPAKDVINN